MTNDSFTLLQMLGGMEKKAGPETGLAAPVAAAESSAAESKGALNDVKSFGEKAIDTFKNPNSAMNSWLRGEKLQDGNWYRKLVGKLGDALPKGKDAYKGIKGVLPRLGRSLYKRPGKAGLIGAGLATLGTVGASMFGDDDSINIPALDSIPEEWRMPLMAGAAAVPVLGAAAGGLSGSGMLRGAAKGLGAVGGGYLGYQGGKYLSNYLRDSDIADGLGDQGKSLLSLASILGGTALGGIGGSSLAGAIVPEGV